MAIEQAVASREELIGRAEGLVPTLRQRALETEKLRRIPDATVNDLAVAGLTRLPNPGRFGGYEHDIDLMFEVAMELGRGCGSTAWCYAVWAIHNWMLGHWPQQAQEEYFADGPDVLSSSAFAPAGTLRPVGGGYRLSGRWQFSSGSDAGTWALLGAMGPQGPRLALVPRHDYEIIDTWFVSGLKGTGSKDVRVDEAFVPEHRLGALMGDVRDSRAFELHGRPSYRLPPMSLLPFTLCSPLVGMAQGAVDEFVGRSLALGKGSLVALQLRLAESSAEVDAARLTVRTRTHGLIEAAAAGRLPSALEMAAVRRDYGFVARLCVRAVDRLFEATGGHSLFETEAMQRFQRDVHAGSHQAALYWDPIAEAYGQAVFEAKA